MALQIVIVDDDHMVVYLHKKLLEKVGLATDPVVAYNGKEALDYIKREIRNDDDFLLLLDINMPDIDGWEVLNELAKMGYRDRVYAIIITSSVNKVDKDMARNYENVIGFFEKPVKTADFQNIKSIPQLEKYFV